MAGFLYLICALTCLCGGAYLLYALSVAVSAPQQAAAAAMTAAWVVVTYCLARCVSETDALDQRDKLLKALRPPEKPAPQASEAASLGVLTPEDVRKSPAP